MTMQAILEQDQERFLRALGQARTPAEASGAVRDECGRMLAAYNQEAVTDAEREAAYQMMTAVSAAASLTDSAGEPKVYVRDGEGRLLPDSGGTLSVIPGAGAAAGAKSGKVGAVKEALSKLASPLLLAGGAAALAAGPLSAALTGSAGGAVSIPGMLGLTVLGGFAMWFSGRLAAVRRAANMTFDIQTELAPDAEKIYRNLLTMTMVMDKTLSEAAGRKALAQSAGSTESSRLEKAQEAEVINLISGILETASTLEDREAASDLISQLKYYLHSHDIEAADYSPETAYAFDRIPAQEEETLRPALIRGEKVLVKGLATRRSS